MKILKDNQFINESTKRLYLQYLFTNTGNKLTDFELCYMNQKSNTYTKWKKLSECKNGFLKIANNRTLLKNEIVLDLEEPERYNKIIDGLEQRGFKYYAFVTGSRGIHFHLLFDSSVTPENRLQLIKEFGCDLQKKSNRCMIALEYENHWKTGKPKVLDKYKEGLNKYTDYFTIEETKEEEKSLNLIKVSDWINKPIPETNWLIKPLIPESSVNILFGDNGSLKTFLALLIAVVISKKINFLNNFETQNVPVLFINEEMSYNPFRRRIKRMLNGLGDSSCTLIHTDLEGVKFTNHWKFPIEEAIKNNGLKLIIIDSLIRVMEGDENSAESVREVFDFCKYFIKTYGTSFLFLHHERKGKSKFKSKQDMRGSSDFGAMCDSTMRIHKVSKNYYILTQTKNRHEEEIDPIQIFVNDPDPETISFSYGGAAPKQRKTKEEVVEEEVVDWLQSEKVQKFRTTTVEARCKVSKPIALNALKILESKGYIRSQGYDWIPRSDLCINVEVEV